MTLLHGSDYLCVCCFCSPSAGLRVFSLPLPLPYETQQNSLSADRRIRVCLSPGNSASNSSREVGMQPQECQVYFIPKEHQGSMKSCEAGKRKIQWETLCYTSVCPLPVPGKIELLTRQGTGRRLKYLYLLHSK